jgi:hypothetical protein
VLTESMVLSEGTILAGYRVKGVIGFGEMAIVYRAEQVSLGREVALKVLPPAFTHGEAFRERFRSDGRNIAALDHPNIISMFDSGDADGRLFLGHLAAAAAALSAALLTRFVFTSLHLAGPPPAPELKRKKVLAITSTPGSSTTNSSSRVDVGPGGSSGAPASPSESSPSSPTSPSGAGTGSGGTSSPCAANCIG